jgi:hypothetical protein
MEYAKTKYKLQIKDDQALIVKVKPPVVKNAQKLILKVKKINLLLCSNNHKVRYTAFAEQFNDKL